MITHGSSSSNSWAEQGGPLPRTGWLAPVPEPIPADQRLLCCGIVNGPGYRHQPFCEVSPNPLIPAQGASATVCNYLRNAQEAWTAGPATGPQAANSRHRTTDRPPLPRTLSPTALQRRMELAQRQEASTARAIESLDRTLAQGQRSGTPRPRPRAATRSHAPPRFQ